MIPPPFLSLDVDNGTGPRPFTDWGAEPVLGSFGSNKIAFSSPREIWGGWEERRCFPWALLYVTIAIEMRVKGA